MIERATSQFSVTPPDSENKMKFLGPNAESLGEYQIIGPIPEGPWILPASDSLAFPVKFRGDHRICSFSGPMARGVAMFVMHKTAARILPLTSDLRKMVASFDRHEDVDTTWMIHELGMEAILGKEGALDIVRLALERGFVKKTKRGLVRTGKKLSVLLDQIDVRDYL